MKNIIAEFNKNEEKFAKETVIYCQKNKKKVKEQLLSEVDRFIANIDDYRDKYCEASVAYSILLLAEFKDKRLFSRIVNIINLCNIKEGRYLWEGVIDSYDNIIVSVFDENYSALDDIIRNHKISVYTRYDCLKAYLYFYNNGTITKDKFTKYLQDIIDYYNYEDDAIYTWIAYLISDAKLFELMPIVRKLYEKSLIETGIIGKYDEFVDSIFDYNHINKTHIIENVVDEMGWWYCFKENQDKDDKKIGEAFEKLFMDAYQITNKKVGRNELCPCGSGKKYKRCCAIKKRLPYQKYIDESIDRYPKKKTNENETDIYDIYNENAIEIDKLMYSFLCHKAIPIFIKRDYKLEEEMNIEICDKIVQLLKSKLEREHYNTIDDYDIKNSIHYSLYYFFIKYTDILLDDLESNGYTHKLYYVDRLEEILDLFYNNFDINDKREIAFIDRRICLYRYKDKIEEMIQYLEYKLNTCVPEMKYDIYVYLIDIIAEYYKDKDRINKYIKNEKDSKLKQRLKELIKDYAL